MTIKEFFEQLYYKGVDLDTRIYIKPANIENPLVYELTEEDEIKDITIVSVVGGETKIYLEN
jgi:hypothetical protein